MTKHDAILKINSVFNKRLAKIKSQTFKKYEEKLQISTWFFEDVYDKLKKEYKGLNGKKILSTIEIMLKELKMNEEEVDKTERTMKFIAMTGYIIELICDMLIYIALGFIFTYLANIVINTAILGEMIYLSIGFLFMMWFIVYPFLKFIEDIICGVIWAPIVEETSKLFYTNKGLITKYIQMFNLNENFGYYLYKDPDTGDIYYDIETGIVRMRTQCLHIITGNIMKTNKIANSKFLSYLTAICIHALFNFTATIPGVIGYKLWLMYSNHLITKYGDMLDEYKEDILRLKQEKNKKVNVKESVKHKKVIRCYPNVQFI